MHEVTRLLSAVELGEPGAAEELLPLVYDELRRLAARKLSHEAAGHTLDATALVHEAYLRLVGDEAAGWNSRGHFFGAAAEAMRRILVENARRKHRLKHGGHWHRVSLDAACLSVDDPGDELLALDEVLQEFEQQEPDIARLVKLRYFAGLTSEQAAECVGVSRATAARHWAFARAWLYERLRDHD